MRDPYHECHDTDHREPTPADVSYIVCSTMRCGSNLLCEGIDGDRLGRYTDGVLQASRARAAHRALGLR